MLDFIARSQCVRCYVSKTNVYFRAAQFPKIGKIVQLQICHEQLPQRLNLKLTPFLTFFFTLLTPLFKNFPKTLVLPFEANSAALISYTFFGDFDLL